MIVCPLCEHSQASGSECDNCGRPFSGQAPSGAASVERMADLEPNSDAPVGAVEAETIPELEQTLLDPVADAPAGEAFGAELESGRSEAVPDTAPAREGRPPCRYCRQVPQPDDAFCGKCGMKLPLFGDPVDSAAGDETPQSRCRQCGVVGLAGSRCENCGARVIAPTA